MSLHFLKKFVQAACITARHAWQTQPLHFLIKSALGLKR